MPQEQRYDMFRRCIYCDATGERIIKNDNGEVTGTVPCENCEGEGYTPSGVLITDTALSEILSVCNDILDKCNDIFEKVNEEKQEQRSNMRSHIHAESKNNIHDGRS